VVALEVATGVVVAPVVVLEVVLDGAPDVDEREKKYAIPMRITAAIIMVAMI
jgi:hypothetical protein